MANPTVSIVIPCYNSEATLGETLDSLQEQTFHNWEAVVVNDGSTDRSESVIDSYCARDVRIRKVDQENQGLAGARNAGLLFARGQFVNFLDADDLLLPTMLQRMLERLREDESIGAVHCAWIYTDPKAEDRNWVCSIPSGPDLFYRLAHRNTFACHSILFRRSSLENAGDFDVTLRHCHDWDLWLRVARTGIRFGWISEPLVLYRMMPGSLSRNPFSFFEAGSEIIYRGHRRDPRVINASLEFVGGCKCNETESARLSWLMVCVGLAVGAGHPEQASLLMEKTLACSNVTITPETLGAMRHALWFSARVSPWNWDALCRQVGRSLLVFLLREEERLKVPGFAMESLRELLKPREKPNKPGLELEKVGGWVLLKELRKRVAGRLSGVWLSRSTQRVAKSQRL